MQIKTVTVIGATGSMGRNIAGIFAAFGNAKVYLMGRDIEKVRNTIPLIIKSVRADSIERNLIPVDYYSFDKCIADSDMIFDSSPEDIFIKKEMAKKISFYMNDKAISCTGTSGLSVTEIAEEYTPAQRKRFFGVHFFNPPYSMPLCELINTKYSDLNFSDDLFDYLKEQLCREVIRVKDSPAFVANRIGFYFINEAAKFAENYSVEGGIDYIDYLLGLHTGRLMPPLETIDFVGLDVHKAIVENLGKNTKDYANGTYYTLEYINELISKGNLGNKTKAGLYKIITDENGNNIKYVWDIKEKGYRAVKNYNIHFVEKMKEYISNGDYEKAFEVLSRDGSKESEMILTLMLKYILYAFYLSEELGIPINYVDKAMSTGFNWCPPQALYYALKNNLDDNLINKVAIEEGINVQDFIKKAEKSKYDYRTYFRR